MNFDLIFKLVIGILGLATATVVAIKTVKEVKAREASGLKGNPERCKEHADRLTALEGKESDHAGDLGQVRAAIDLVGRDVKTLLDLHLRG